MHARATHTSRGATHRWVRKEALPPQRWAHYHLWVLTSIHTGVGARWPGPSPLPASVSLSEIWALEQASGTWGQALPEPPSLPPRLALLWLSPSLPVTPAALPPADSSSLRLSSGKDPVPGDLAAHTCSTSSPKGRSARTFLFTRSLLRAPGGKVKNPVLEPHCCVCVILGQ